MGVPRGDRAGRDRRRAREFEAFVAGAAGRLLRVAALLTTEPLEPPEPLERPAPLAPLEPHSPGQAGGDGKRPSPPPAARELLHHALAHTYARWDPRTDPYDTARWQLIHRFTRHARRHRRPRGGPLGVLTPQERVVLVLCVYEEVDEDRVAASLGLPADRVRALRA
ncbi:hypothetical protein GL263_20615, partial [Streptomyces durbertensis]